jgi:DTW domain-containing protein YfiP
MLSNLTGRSWFETRGRFNSSYGTWRQTRKIHSRHPELSDIPRVKISTPNHSTFQLRAQSRPEGMATLQAIASALGIIKGDQVAAQLMRLYRARLDRTLSARGLLRPS